MPQFAVQVVVPFMYVVKTKAVRQKVHVKPLKPVQYKHGDKHKVHC